MILQLDKNITNAKTDNIVIKDLYLSSKTTYLNNYRNKSITRSKLGRVYEYLLFKLKSNPSLRINRDLLEDTFKDKYKFINETEGTLYNFILSIQPLVKNCIDSLNISRNEKFNKKKIFDASYLDCIKFTLDNNIFCLKMESKYEDYFKRENPDIYNIHNILLEVLISLYLNHKLDFDLKENFEMHEFTEFFKLGILLNFHIPLPIFKRVTQKTSNTRYYPFYPGFNLIINNETYSKIVKNIHILK